MLKYVYPLVSFLFFLVLLFFSSFFFSINAIHSSSQLFLWAGYACIFLLSIGISIKFSHQKRFLFLCFIVASGLFIGHSLNKSLFPFLSVSPYQFILRVQDVHNHLGDLAGLIIVSLFLNPTSLFLTGPALLFTFAIMVVSFSKSAFLGVLVVLFILALQKKRLYRIGFLVILCFSALVIGIYTSEFSGIPFIRSGQKIMVKTLHLNPKPLFSVRDSYYPQVFRAWNRAPLEQKLFGFGPGNYIYPSIGTGISTDLTPTETHNIFLSLFIENGVLSLFWFLMFCIFILIEGLKQKNPSVYLFIYLLVNFQTDFTYAIPFFMALFFVFAGQCINKKKFRDNLKSPLFLAFIVCVGGLTLFSGISYVSIMRNKKSLDTQLAAAVKKNDKPSVQDTIQKLERITPYEESELVKWSSIQEMMGNTGEAVRLLEKLSVYSPRWYLLYLPHQFELQKKDKVNLKKYIEGRKKDFARFPFSPEEKKKFNAMCVTYTNLPCMK